MSTEILKSDPNAKKSLQECEFLLRLGNNYTPEDVLKSFEVSYNEIEKDDFAPFLEAKNTLLQHLISSQMKKKRFFSIQSPFENSCVSCRGTGEIYKFRKKSVKVNCHICAGKKEVKVECPLCFGSGRFIKRWKTGGGINVSCRKCKGTGKVGATCIECRGVGELTKMVLDHEIKSTTPCNHCQQLGFTTNKPPKKKKKRKKGKTYKKKDYMSNPVLSHDLASKIKEAIEKKQGDN